MKTQEKIGEYLQFTRKDRIAILTIAFILIIVFLLPSFLGGPSPGTAVVTDTAWISALQQLEQPAFPANNLQQDGYKGYDGRINHRTRDVYNNAQQAQLFVFDPNTLDAEGWRRLGVKEKTVETIRKYLSKGGRFCKADELYKIYGLSPSVCERLIPFVRIKNEDDHLFAKKDLADNRRQPPANRFHERLDVNTADSARLESLPGIGPVLASRIVRFRQKLGGFYTVDQLKEVFGLSDSAYQNIASYLYCDNPAGVRKIDITNATIDELKTHPYIRNGLATLIVNYRSQHGLRSPDDLRRIAVIGDSLFMKIRPYIRCGTDANEREAETQ